MDDRNNWNELQSNFCGVIIVSDCGGIRLTMSLNVLKSVVRRLGGGIQPMADRVMTLVLQLIQAAGKTSTILEDAFLVVGAMASGQSISHPRDVLNSLMFLAALEAKFAPYIGAFLPFMVPALQAHEDTQLCQVAVGIIGDISRALGEQSAQYAEPFMSLLLNNLQSEVLNRNVKISILASFGDIALAIGPKFAPYLDTAMGVLGQAGSVQPNPVSTLVTQYMFMLTMIRSLTTTSLTT